MIDADHQINAVRRTVGDRTLDAGEARVVTISQSYDTDAADLWDACTSIERIPRWFLPVSGDLRVGGRYELEGNAHGTVLTCDAPREFTATWECGGAVSWIEVRIFEEGAHRSRFELQHIAHVDDHWEQFGPGATGMGYDGALVGLTIHLATGETVDQSSGHEWMASDEGRRFTRSSGEAWYEANIAAGADREWARAAADRCIAAYLGEN
jgi:uncharacterized protein YndB with AHSA1/START domain